MNTNIIYKQKQVADFGEAKWLPALTQDRDGDAAEPVLMSMRGTTRYMAPEVLY